MLALDTFYSLNKVRQLAPVYDGLLQIYRYVLARPSARYKLVIINNNKIAWSIVPLTDRECEKTTLIYIVVERLLWLDEI